ncbi:NlpC/P60 family protein [Actinoplanes sp. NBRC 103695]|uniref:NlpC/P60 family protein n=1 Tax=Actinoplanes sp. NBRC 103695 TaxID=3032202 RepID=UPI0024A39DF9|nr:NlpC/P60 family protein [Actinoplanes sp. NBRC 103695]GLZ01375.1 hypothetical protein Acsp02_86260 [Actinoplanes sp. NBRC 103695]
MRRWILVLGGSLIVVLGSVAVLMAPHGDDQPSWSTPPPGSRAEAARSGTLARAYELRRADDPPRTIVYDKGQPVATLTDGARTVAFHGPPRTFVEASVSAKVVTDQWVRVAPEPWSPKRAKDPEMSAWFHASLGSTEPDILQFTTEYLRGAPPRRDDKGDLYAGDAGFGIERGAGVDGADFHEFMGIPWTFPDDTTVPANPRWLGKLDCSGFLRIVYGYRGGLPLLTGTTRSTVDGMPRTANAMAYYARSAVVAAGSSPERAPRDLGDIQPGDLVFFAMRDDPAKVSHSGIFLGVDVTGHPRFVSSRGVTRGPSFGDTANSSSTLDDSAFSAALRRVIRL